MIGIWNAYIDIYLYVIGAVMLVGFGIPLFFAPMLWARLFRWEIPQQQNLAVFLGRTVGLLIGVLSVFAILAANTPGVQRFFLDMMLSIAAGSLLLHVHGAIKKVQPITETIEIVVWVILLIVTLGFYPI